MKGSRHEEIFNLKGEMINHNQQNMAAQQTSGAGPVSRINERRFREPRVYDGEQSITPGVPAWRKEFR